MTREIKFRGWYNNGFMSSIISLKELWKIKPKKDWDYPDIIMQYTGLKDNNGKEIYFDDIIEHGIYLYQVIWNYNKLGFKQIKTTIIDFSDLTDGGDCLKKKYGYIFNMENLFNFDSCEIIGNIYENPELIINN